MKFYDWRMDAIKGGHGYHVDIGAFSTPIVGGGEGTTITQDEPEGIISITAGYTLIPIRIHVVCQMPLIAADNNESEILIAVDKAAALAGDGTATAETPVNMHTGSSNTSAATCKSATTGAYTSPTLGMELAHAVKLGNLYLTNDSSMWADLSLLYEPITPPILTGPCAIYIYWGGTVATSGFAQVEWIELADA
jgi:hypothetical protein